MGFLPEQCIVIEDSDIGIEAAKSAGMIALKYSDGKEDQKRLNEFSNMELLPKWIDTIYDNKVRSSYL